MTTQNTSINSTDINSNIEGNNMDVRQQLIQSLIADFQSNPMNFTSYRQQIETALRTHIKPLTPRSGKSSDGNDWRSQLKSQFSGRGAKWVFVPTESVIPTLDSFDARGIDTTEYRILIEQHGQAWIRFVGPRVHQGKPSASFEIRTLGSTIHQPKELHYIDMEDLDSMITPMNTTPFALNLESVKENKAELKAPENTPTEIDEEVAPSIEDDEEFESI